MRELQAKRPHQRGRTARQCGSDALSERDNSVHSTRDIGAHSERNADVRSDNAGGTHSEQTAIVIDRGKGTNGVETAVVGGLSATSGVTALSMGLGQGDGCDGIWRRTWRL